MPLDHGSILSAEIVAAGTYHPPEAPAIALPGLPKFCRVVGVANPTPDSVINFQVWIPFDGSYRNRFLQVGNGGFSGAVVYDALAEGIRRGYATASTDDGNQMFQSPAFVVGHPEKLVDYGHRALKQTTDKAKAIIAALTDNPPARSYFHGCSNGGREALMEVQRYPADFDGVAAGAPANYFTHQFTGFAWNAQKLYAPATIVPSLSAARLSILSSAVRAQCAGHDGGLASDRFLTNPAACHVNFTPITCGPASDPSTCLTAAEVAVVKDIYAGPVHAVTSQQIYPGPEPGAEAFACNWPLWVTGVQPAVPGHTTCNAPDPFFGLQVYFGAGFFGAFVHGIVGPYDLHGVNFSTDVDNVDATLGPTLNATDPDLRSFFDHGGKLIQYHGFDDSAVAPRNSINYWASVEAKMKALHPGFSHADLDSFYRLFMVPGMSHCSLGEGANEFGNGPRGSAMDAEHDVMLALENWVEHGVAPERIVARHRGRTFASNFERPLCPYPKLPRYDGSGPTNTASSWTCAVPNVRVKPDILFPKLFPKQPIRPGDPVEKIH